MGEHLPFSGILQQPAAVDGLRAAAGIYVPNHAWRDANAALYTGTVEGQDGLTWNLSKFARWYYYGNAINDSYGSYTTAKAARGAFDALSAYMATTATTTGESISTNHRVLAQTIYSDPVDFASRYQAHSAKPITLALTVRVPTDVTIGTDLKAYLACYSSAGTHLSSVELVFDDAGTTGDSPSWSRLLATTAAALHATTDTVQLHIGLKSPDGANTGIDLADCALMLNPATTDRAVDGSPELFIDLGSAIIGRTPAMSWQNIGGGEGRMLDGHLVRTATASDSLKFAIKAAWSGKSGVAIDDTVYQQLVTVWNLSRRGLGLYVPEPVEVCIDFGLGQAPFFSYYHVAEIAFNGTFHPFWELNRQLYQVAMTFVEV